jgi:peptidoglycan/LPS O-acetylase OafA/YrhL
MTEALHLPGGRMFGFDPAHAKYHFGVDVFFVISGLIMVYSTAGQSAAVENGVRFFVARFLRISPLYWVVTFVAALLASTIGTGFNHAAPDAARLLTSLFYIPYRNEDGDLFPIVGPGWTLNYEMMFYVVFAVGLAFWGRRGLWVTIGVLALIVILGNLSHSEQPQLAFWSSPILLEFVFGMLLGDLLVRGRLDGWPKFMVYALLLTGLGWYLVPWFGEYVRTDWRFFFFGVPAALVVAAAVIGDRQCYFPRLRWGEVVGDASYSIYLTHLFTIRGLSMIWAKLPVQLPAHLFVVVALVLVVGVGIVVARSVEIPMHHLTREWLRRRRPVAAPT